MENRLKGRIIEVSKSILILNGFINSVRIKLMINNRLIKMKGASHVFRKRKFHKKRKT